MRGKTISFQIDNATAVAYLLKEGGTHCKTLNGEVRRILLRCHRNRIVVCSEYFWGVLDLIVDDLFRGKNAQEWSVRDPTCNRLYKWWGIPVLNLCTSKQTSRQITPVSQLSPLIQESIQGRCIEEGVTKRAKVCLPPKHHSSILRKTGEVGRVEREPDHDLAFLAKPELLPRDNVASDRTTKVISSLRVVSVECSDREAIQKVHKDVWLTIWGPTSPSMSEVASQRKLPGRSFTPRHKEPSSSMKRCLNSGVLPAMRRGYHSLKFV